MTTAVLHGKDGGNPLIMDTAVYRSMNSAQGWGGEPLIIGRAGVQTRELGTGISIETLRNTS